MARHPARANLPAPYDDTIRSGNRLYSKRGQTLRHDLYAIGFLNPELFGACQYSFAVGTSGCDKKSWKLIYGEWNLVLGDMNPLQVCAPNPDISHRLAPDFSFVNYRQVAAHGTKDIDHSNAGGIYPDMLQRNVGAFRNAGGHHEESRGGNIGRHINLGSFELSAPLIVTAGPLTLTS